MTVLKWLSVICFVLFNYAMFGVEGSATGATKPEGSMTLLGTMEEWKYPGSKMPQGATMSGNGPYPPMQFVTCQTVLTTPDPMEKVVEFYSKKLKSVPDKNANIDMHVKIEDAQSVFVQDDSKGRPVPVHVILVNRAKSSTSLVISRAPGEKETHIAWLHFVRFGEK